MAVQTWIHLAILLFLFHGPLYSAGLDVASRTQKSDTKQIMPLTGDSDLDVFLKSQELAVRVTAARSWFSKKRRRELPAFMEKLFTQGVKDLESAQPKGALNEQAAKLNTLLKALHQKREAALKLIFDDKKYSHAGGQTQVNRLVFAAKSSWHSVYPKFESYRNALNKKQIRHRGAYLIELYGYFWETQQAYKRYSRRAARRPKKQSSPKKQTKAEPRKTYTPKFPYLFKEMGISDKNERALKLTSSRTLDLNSFEKENVNAVNEYRRRMGIPSMSVHQALVVAARKHSTEMRDKGYFSHVSPTASKKLPHLRIAAAGYSSYTTGENIALGKFTPESAFTAWYKSAGHHRNMLREKYREIGLGVVGRGKSKPTASIRTWWTQAFGGGQMSKQKTAGSRTKK